MGLRLGLLLTAFIFLIINAVVIYVADGNSKLGILVSVSVFLMDLYTFLLYHSQTVSSPVSLIFLIILNRVLMISLG
jgi:hypothetical protein